MRPRVFLHVGSPKTGTTFLQDVLWAQRSTARERGLLLPGGRFHDHFLATLDVRGLAEDPNYPPAARGMWARLVDEALRWDGNVLISHELFAGATAEQAQRAVAAFGDAEVHVVVTARDHVRQVAAEWQEHVKHRSTGTFADFVRTVREDHLSGAHASWFWQVQDYAGVLDRWGASLPRERLHLVTVPGPGADPTILWDRFARLIGLDPAAFDTALERSNSSLGAEQTELLRRVNLELGERLPLPGPYPLVVKNVLAHRILEPRPGTRITLPASDEEFARSAAADVVARLADLDVDVVGDLAELVPAERPVEDGPSAGGSATDAGDSVPADTTLLAESIATIAELLVVLNERRAAVHRADDLVATAQEKPVRFALVHASEQRPLLRRVRGAYRRVKARAGR